MKYSLDMRDDNYQKWLQLVSSRPHMFAIFLKRLFNPKEDGCTCLTDGKMYIRGNINDCIKCADTVCTLDTHLFLGNSSTAILGWLAMILEGKN